MQAAADGKDFADGERRSDDELGFPVFFICEVRAICGLAKEDAAMGHNSV